MERRAVVLVQTTMIVGVIFPYFVASPWWTLGSGAFITALIWLGTR